jgi:glycosyltransferase involved in cell wall biosynthesis
MRDYLRRIRAYLYTGTQPASYTLGLIEAMMTGVPVVSIGPDHMTWQRDLFEGHELARTRRRPDPALARDAAERRAHDNPTTRRASAGGTRARARIELFGIETVGPQWREFLGDRTSANS